MVKYLIAWVPMLVIAFANGALRETTYGRRMAGPRANAISCATGIAALGVFIWLFSRSWPAASAMEALAGGVAWLVLTVAFEFGFGRLRGRSWPELLRDYDVPRGRLWPLVLLWITIAPLIFHSAAAARR